MKRSSWIWSQRQDAYQTGRLHTHFIPISSPPLVDHQSSSADNPSPSAFAQSILRSLSELLCRNLGLAFWTFTPPNSFNTLAVASSRPYYKLKKLDKPIRYDRKLVECRPIDQYKSCNPSFCTLRLHCTGKCHMFPGRDKTIFIII